MCNTAVCVTSTTQQHCLYQRREFGGGTICLSDQWETGGVSEKNQFAFLQLVMQKLHTSALARGSQMLGK